MTLLRLCSNSARRYFLRRVMAWGWCEPRESRVMILGSSGSYVFRENFDIFVCLALEPDVRSMLTFLSSETRSTMSDVTRTCSSAVGVLGEFEGRILSTSVISTSDDAPSPL